MTFSIAKRMRLAAFPIGLFLLTSTAFSQPTSELDELRRLIAQQRQIIDQQLARDEQQQRQIETLSQQVRVLQESSGSAEQIAQEIDNAREVETTAPLMTIERAQQDLNDWTLQTLGASQTEPEVTEEVIPGEITTSPEGFTVSIGGHVSRAVNIADDGDDTKGYFVDNGNVPTLAYLKASAPVSDDLTIGGHIETSLQDNSANAVSQDKESSGFNADGRFFELTATSKRYGKLWFGKGFSSAFALGDLDKSGTIGPNMLSVGNTAGGLKFFDKDLDRLSDTRVGEVFIDAESLNLRNRVRYDSPTWKGFRLGGDMGEDQYSDISLRWNRDVGDFELTLIGTGQKNPTGGRVDRRYDGAFGVWHKSTGLNLTIGGARQKFKANNSKDSDGYIARLGLRRNWFSFGETRTAIDYSLVEDITENGDKGKSAGAFLVQEVEDWNMEFYTGYRWYDFDRDSDNLEDIHVLNLGARIHFDLTTHVPAP